MSDSGENRLQDLVDENEVPEELDQFDPQDVEPSKTMMRFWRLAIVLVVAATVIALIGLGSGGRARSAVSAIGDGASAAAGWIGDQWTERTESLQAMALDEPVRPLAAVGGPEGSASMFVGFTDETGAGRSYALFATSPEGVNTVVLFPPGLLSIIPGYGDFALSQAALFEDVDLAALAVSNMLGIRIDHVVAIEPGQLTEALFDGLVVDLPVPLIVEEGDGARVLADQGLAERSAAVVEVLLTTVGDGGELELMQRQGAVWEALLAAMVAAPDLGDRVIALAGPGGDLLAAAASDEELSITAVPVDRTSIGQSDAFTLDQDALPAFVSDRVAHLLLREGARPRAEVLNGSGQIQATSIVAESLVNRGFQIIRTDNANAFDYEESQVIAQGRDNRAIAEEVVKMLGTGELVLEVRAQSGVVDVSIIVGQDIPSPEG